MVYLLLALSLKTKQLWRIYFRTYKIDVCKLWFIYCFYLWWRFMCQNYFIISNIKP